MFNTSRDTRSITRRVTLGAIALCCLIAPLSDAQTLKPTRHSETANGVEVQPSSKEIEVDIRGVKVKIPDLVLRDQEGRKVRFYSDLIKDKVIVLSFFYTSCPYLCTMQGKVFSELQSLLGERLGKSVLLISVSTDPVRDTPQQLKAWGARYKVKPGWILVTGEEAEMNKLLLQFTGNQAGGGMHIPATFVANDKTGIWTSAVGVLAPEQLLQAVNSVTQ